MNILCKQSKKKDLSFTQRGFNNVCCRKGGFTILEMLVSVALFTVIVVMSIGVIIVIIDANKQTRSLSVSMGNIEFHFKEMFREASSGSNYHCAEEIAGSIHSKDCSGSFHNFFGFTDVYGNDVYYRQDNSQIEASYNGSAFMPITDSSVVIGNFGAMVIDSDPASVKDPLSLYINVKGEVVGQGEKKSEFNFQTMVTQRLDLSILID
ncbi:MAG: type II secretion system protein [Candidatus Pacebacteria bacterium]|nr:type II secretion system protein [Candidatus Paceibacterota bacterium]